MITTINNNNIASWSSKKSVMITGFSFIFHHSPVLKIVLQS